MIKLIVSDLDGTLLGHDKRVHPREREALQRAAQQGIRLCLASGRMHGEMRDFAKMAGSGDDAFVISINGAYVFGSGDKLLYETAFDEGLAPDVLEAASGLQVGILACTGDVNLTPEQNEIVSHVNQRLVKPILVMPDLAEKVRSGQLRLCKFSFFGDMEELRRLEAVVERSLAGRATWYVTDKDCFDVMPFGVTKGNGLKRLLRELQIRPEETVCIGDSFNDVSMFEVTPHSFAMAESDPLIRRAARHTACNVAEAVEWALKRNMEEAI